MGFFENSGFLFVGLGDFSFSLSCAACRNEKNLSLTFRNVRKIFGLKDYLKKGCQEKDCENKDCLQKCGSRDFSLSVFFQKQKDSSLWRRTNNNDELILKISSTGTRGPFGSISSVKIEEVNLVEIGEKKIAKLVRLLLTFYQENLRSQKNENEELKKLLELSKDEKKIIELFKSGDFLSKVKKLEGKIIN